MGSRMKEDEKNERIIRGLLKQPCNRKCINCNLLGPQYVCTTFSTFVCPTCSGIHREFTHRVKSISMAKFTPQEVAALQAGGNEHAREIYFKEWEPQRNSAPDTSNVDRLRDFIKHVYVHRRYAGERSVDRPPRVELRTTSSSSLASSNSNPTEPIKGTSLIDFDAEPEPSLTAATTQTQPSTASAPPSDDNWTCFDKVPKNKVSQPFLNSNSSESVLTQLSVPAPSPICGAVNSSVAPAPLDDLFSLSSGSDAIIASAGNATSAVFAGAPATASFAGASTVLPVNGGTVQWSAMQQDQQSFLHGSATQPAAQPLPSSFSSGPNNHSLTGNPSSQGSQVANPSAQTEEMKSRGSKELPVDLFTVTYLNAPYQALGWQDGGLVPGMGYQMHFNPAMGCQKFMQCLHSHCQAYRQILFM